MLVWAKGLGLAALALLAPAHPLLIAALVLTAIDCLTGIMAARKRGERIRSAGLRRTVSKSAVYVLAIIVGFIAETWLLGGVLPVSKLIAGAIGIVECKSCLENLDVVNGGSLFATIVGKLGSANDKPKGE